MAAHVPLAIDGQFLGALTNWYKDLDNTLVVSSFEKAIYPAILDTQQACGRTTDIPLEVAREFWFAEHRLPIMVEHFDWPTDEPQIHFWELFRRYENVERRVAHTSIIPGALEAVKRILSQGRRIHVVTATGRAMAEGELALFRQEGIHLPFTALGDIDAPFAQKPDPAVIRHLLRQHGVRHHRAVVVGDHKDDMRMAKAAGVHSLYMDVVDRHCPDAAASCSAHFKSWADVPLQ